MRDKFFCPSLRRQVTVEECNSKIKSAADDGCTKDCEVRNYWLSEAAQPDPPLKAVQEPREKPNNIPDRKCNMCGKIKEWNELNFRTRKDGKGLKKTCRQCEDKYLNKAKPEPKKTQPKRNKTQPKTQYQPEPDPAPDVPEPVSKAGSIDLSEFTKVTKTRFSRPDPYVKFYDKNICFNTAAMNLQAMQGAKTIDPYYKLIGNKLLLVLDPKADETGEYRLSFDKGKGAKFSLVRVIRETSPGPGPWAVDEVDGFLTVEVML